MKVVHILPNLRKGLSNDISTSIKDSEGLRAGFNVKLQMDGHQAGSDSVAKKSLDHEFFLAGPVDVRGVSAKAISQVVPADMSIGFSNGYMPYVEFLDEDLPWRYTPLPTSDKLVPWLLLLACKDGEFTENLNPDGTKSVSISLEGTSGDELSSFYPDQGQFYKLAHVQISAPEGEDPIAYVKDNPDDGVSRLFCSRKLVPQTKYTMFLVPAFELGRLAGLKQDFKGRGGVSKLSWDKDFVSNEFPVYYQWSFTTGGETFMKLARKQKFLSDQEFEGLSPGLSADISDTGLKKSSMKDDLEPIDIPVALVKKGFDESKLREEDESMRRELKEDLLLKSPVFSENANAGEVFEDPWVVPPVYGARHILAEPRDLDNNDSFFKDLNLKFRNRVAAGMGANVVKRNQEMFVNRAWGVIEDINALNQRIREFYQVMKTNDASEEKITALRYYKFLPHAWGLQADAAIRVANAQSSANVNAIDLALDATDDSGKSLNVMTTSMGPFTRNGGISVQELRDITDPALWSSSAYGIIPREEPYLYVSGTENYFDRNTKYSFMRDLFWVGHPNVSFSVQNGAPKINLTPGQRGTLFSFERNYKFEESFLSLVLASTSPICNSREVFSWLGDSDLFQFENSVPVSSLVKLNQSFLEAKNEYEKLWNGVSIPDLDKLIPNYSDYLANSSPLLPLIATGMCLPVVFCSHLYIQTNKRVALSIGEHSFEYGLFVHKNKYDELFGNYPDGVAIEHYVNNQKCYLYLLPSDKIKDLANDSNCSVYYKYVNDDVRDGNVHELKLKLKDGSKDTFEPVEDKSFKSSIWFGGVKLKRSDKTLLPKSKYKKVSGTHRQVFFRNNLLSVVVNSWTEDLKGKKKMQIEYVKNGKHGVRHDSGKRYYDLLTKNGYKYSLVYQNGGIYLSQSYNLVFSSDANACICLSSGDGLFQKNGDDVTVDLDVVHTLLTTAIDNLNWFSNHIWRPNYIEATGEYYKNIQVLTADDIAGATVDKLTKEMLSTYEKAMKQVTELHNIAMTDPELKKALEGKKVINNIEPAAKPPVVDADEINRKRLVSLANEFAQKGMTLDLAESNFDGKYPIMAAPIFPDPTSFYLRELSEKFILPSVEELKMNSITCFESNLAFEEAFLAGMNTEMGRELLWREYPTDERGSYFRKFWDQVEIPDDFGGYFDVKYMHNWKSRLGQNHEPGKGKMLVFVVRSELMTMYPQTSICLSQMISNRGNAELSCVLSPAMTGWLTNDTFMAGFYTNELKSDKGVYLTFVETDKSQRFNREYAGSADDLSSQFATNRADFGSVWGVEIEPTFLKL